MSIAMEFLHPEQGVWMTSTDKEVHGGSAKAFVHFAKTNNISNCRFYCHAGNAAPFLLLRSAHHGVSYSVLSPAQVSADPVYRLKSLFARHSSDVVVNRPCQAQESVAWYLAVPGMGDMEVVEMLKSHTVWPIANFPTTAHLPSVARLVGELLQPSRFGHDHKAVSRICQYLQLNPSTERLYLARENVPTTAQWAYDSWSPRTRLDQETLARPASFLHRIAMERSVLRATKKWIELLVSYWSQVEMDPTLSNCAGYFLRRPAEKEALQQHLDSVIAKA